MKKLSKKDIESRVAEYRALYPKHTLYFSEDGNCFIEKSPCLDHCKKSNQKWFEDAPTVLKVEKPEGKTKEEATAILLATELDDATDYKLAKELCLVLELETASMKKDDVLFALEAYKETLKPVE